MAAAIPRTASCSSPTGRLLHEALTQSRLMTVTTSGSWNVIPGTNTTAFAVADTGALFGTGGDNPGPYALYQFIPNALAASGIGYQPGNLSPVAAQASSGTAPPFPLRSRRELPGVPHRHRADRRLEPRGDRRGPVADPRVR